MSFEWVVAVLGTKTRDQIWPAAAKRSHSKREASAKCLSMEGHLVTDKWEHTLSIHL